MRVLAGTTDGIYSVDGGAARRVLESRCVRDLVLSGDRLFAGTDAGAFVSDDGAETWSPAGLEERQVWQIRGAGDGVLYASTQPAGLFRSDDAGASWVEIESLLAVPEAGEWCLPVVPPTAARARALVIDADDPRRLWVGVEVGGIMRTADSGKSWRLDLPGGNPDLHMMFAHPARPDVLFASTGYGRWTARLSESRATPGYFAPPTAARLGPMSGPASRRGIRGRCVSIRGRRTRLPSLARRRRFPVARTTAAPRRCCSLGRRRRDLALAVR